MGDFLQGLLNVDDSVPDGAINIGFRLPQFLQMMINVLKVNVLEVLKAPFEYNVQGNRRQFRVFAVLYDQYFVSADEQQLCLIFFDQVVVCGLYHIVEPREP